VTSAATSFVPHIQEIAREAGELLMSHFGKVGYSYKGDVDLVTIADRESEKLIVNRIRGKWPDHDLVGEEGASRETGSDYRWYIDPLDGTTNFAHGFPAFAVSIGLEHKGERIAAVVHDPSRNETFSAEKGSGAYLNKSKMSVSKTESLDEALVATGFPSQKRHRNPNIHFYHQITLRTHGIRRMGSAALDLCYTACGRFDGYWEFNLNPWDTAAGVLLVEEASGVVTGVWEDFALTSKEVLAANPAMHALLRREIQAIMEGRGLEGLPDPREYARTRSF
jgi:myo-inositol-1(or 4)-monophosphatase